MELVMSEEEPVYRQMIGSRSDLEKRTITVAIGVDAQTGVQLDLALGLVGPLMASLSSEAMKLNSQLSEDERMQGSTLRAQAVWLSQDADGYPMMVFELVNGSLLPLAIRSGDIAGLASELALLAAQPPSRAN